MALDATLLVSLERLLQGSARWMTAAEIRSAVGVSPQAVNAHLRELQAQGRTKHEGATRRWAWKTVPPETRQIPPEPRLPPNVDTRTVRERALAILREAGAPRSAVFVTSKLRPRGSARSYRKHVMAVAAVLQDLEAEGHLTRTPPPIGPSARWLLPTWQVVADGAP